MMDFPEAMAWMLEGYPVSREAWNDKDDGAMWVGMDEDEDYRELYLCVEDYGSDVVDFFDFVADEDDMLADDWFIPSDEDEDEYEDEDDDDEWVKDLSYCEICGR